MWFERDFYPHSRPRKAKGGIKAQSKRGQFGLLPRCDRLHDGRAGLLQCPDDAGHGKAEKEDNHEHMAEQQ